MKLSATQRDIALKMKDGQKLEYDGYSHQFTLANGIELRLCSMKACVDLELNGFISRKTGDYVLSDAGLQALKETE